MWSLNNEVENNIFSAVRSCGLMARAVMRTPFHWERGGGIGSNNTGFKF